MGTNYFVHLDTCEHCGRSDPPKHIGKSSGGWCFSLHVGDGCPETLDEWVSFWNQPNARIVDEYGDGVHPDEMFRIITAREWPAERKWTPEDYRQNHAEPGPKGLVRHRNDGRHFIGHGEGTWDLIPGEFS